ncbi:MAG TPA: hypothetical protein VN924_13610 [Bryobacteraceae bacterium]|nr:hypothetical protein [Bryobacteraceae bacterium]
MLSSVRFHKFGFGVPGLALAFLLGLGAFPTQAQTPPPAPPVTVDSSLPNLFYGATPSVCASATSCPTPVLVFVHGLSGSYADWLESANCPPGPTFCGPNGVGAGTGNDMYDYAYENGFRTAFMSLSANNTGNSASIATNAAMLETIFPRILANFGVSKVYFVCHSKGGLDLQAALATPQWIGIANAVILLGTPSQGDALATWVFTTPNGQALGSAFGLLTPAVQSMEIANVQPLRAQWDPIFQNASIPFYTVAGDICTEPTPSQACKNTTTGMQLLSITGGATAPPNDELVTEPETILPQSYSMALGVELQNHYQLRLGNYSFNLIYSRVMAQENQQPGFVRVATNGFGDAANSEAWSMAWFNGQLYVGTGREVYCVTNADAAIETGLPGLYPPAIGNCTADYHHLPLQAEIWQYTPQTDTWVRVFQSPNSLTTTDNTGATVYTARDMGIRSLTLVTEPPATPGGPNVTAMYAGTVTSGAIFEPGHLVGGWPPPRILRTVDGVTWTALPQDPGTFLGNISQPSAAGSSQTFQVFGVRSGGQLNGILYLQVGDFSGVGQVISSVPGTNPNGGDNNYQYASPPASTLPVWILQEFNGFMYAGTGNPYSGGGAPTEYGVWKTAGAGSAPYQWSPIITQGAYASTGSVSNYAMSFEIFPDTLPGGCPTTNGTNGSAGGCLYVGTDQPSEMVRIHPDTTGQVQVGPADSWDLVVGNPRTIPAGSLGAGQAILPVSGIGQYFDNGFTGHFWRMGVGGMGLYMSTYDSSGESADPYNGNGNAENWSQEYGTDLFRTPDGVHWTSVTRIGMGDGMNTGGRTFQETPFGLYWGTARPAVGGTQVFMIDNSVMDFNRDGVIDQKDVNLMTARLGSKALAKDPMDLNQDGMITRADVQLLTTQCTFPKCAVQTKPATAALGVPVLHSAPGALGGSVSLDWPVASGAFDYLVYRINMSASATTPPSFEPLAAACGTGMGEVLPSCDSARARQTAALVGFPGPVAFVTRVTASGATATFTEVPPTTNLQLLYFVRSEDSFGNLSAPSNLVGGPSYAAQ